MHSESLALARHAEEMKDSLDSRELQLEEQARQQERERLNLVSERSEVLRDRAEALRMERGVQVLHSSSGGDSRARGVYFEQLISSVVGHKKGRRSHGDAVNRTWHGGDDNYHHHPSAGDGGKRWPGYTTTAATTTTTPAATTSPANPVTDPRLQGILKAQAKTRMLIKEHSDFLCNIQPAGGP